MNQNNGDQIHPLLGRDKPPRQKEDRIWVLRTGEPISVDHTNKI